MKRKNVLTTISVFTLILLLGLIGESLAATSGSGTKARVAVARFGANDRFAQVYGGWDIGGGLAAQLVTELINSGRVIVVERAILSQLLREQELAASKLVSKETATRVGDMLGVDYLLVGEVTEFEQKAVGGGMQAGFLSGLFPKVSAEFSAAHVGIDLRIIDTATGEILHSQRVEGRAWERATAVDANAKLLTFGGDAFHKTPLGKATRDVIRDALTFTLGIISNQLESYDWLGKVIHQEDSLFYVNVGVGSGVRVGDSLSVFSIKKTLTDPETNQVVGIVEEPVGDLTVVSISEKFAKAKIKDTTIPHPHNGDVVRFSDGRQVVDGGGNTADLSRFPMSKKNYPILD
ncbi:MAG: CsgG/HfaB family protein [Nitrospirota bacterium]